MFYKVVYTFEDREFDTSEDLINYVHNNYHIIKVEYYQGRIFNIIF